MQTRNSFYLRYSKACDLSFEFGEKMEFLKSDQKLKLVLRLDHIASVLWSSKLFQLVGASVICYFKCLPSYSKLCLFLCFSSLIKVQRRMKNPWRSSNGFWRVSQATFSLNLAFSEKYERILNFSFLFTYSRLNKAVSY